jgi:hypothetical protein
MFSGFGIFAGQPGRQKIPVLRTAMMKAGGEAGSKLVGVTGAAVCVMSVISVTSTA